MASLTARRHAAPAVDATLEAWLRGAVALGAFAVLLLPAGRGHSDAIGWLPLWLLAMPLAAWWALHRFALPRWPRQLALEPRRRRPQPQATRRRAGLRAAAVGGMRRAA
jgi:hypothetical protein